MTMAQIATATPRRSVKRIAAASSIGVGVAAFAGYVAYGARPDPRFTMANLAGLTPAQVVATLGPPTIDPRLPRWGGWTPQNSDGQWLVFAYQDPWRWRGFSYGVVFENDRITRVSIGEH